LLARSLALAEVLLATGGPLPYYSSTVTKQQETVVVVDDEPDIRELLEITLGRMGIDTMAAPDLATARRHLGEKAFEILHRPEASWD